jgi:hypothetical protein
MKNPFNITKAVDYSDKELNDFWVDFPKNGFKESIKPTSEMPMIILGSKGSGKTHVMKHFSYTMQVLRHKKNLLKGVIDDGYIGTYLRCSGLNAYKFNGRGEEEHVWESLFSYYLELWLGQLILNNIDNLLTETHEQPNNKLIIEEIISLFDKKPSKIGKIQNLKELSDYFHGIQKNIDFAINNRALTQTKISEQIEILVSPGKLIFGIPEILSSHNESLKGLKFLYLLDEYENFTENQQKYFNTLIRERRNPTCFKIGARRYGLRTRKTLSAGEEIKIGSEYEQLDIDEIFRKNPKNYQTFLKEICLKRLTSHDIIIDRENFDEYFEKFNEEKLFAKIKKREKKHLNKLFRKLNKYYNTDDTNIIVNNLIFDNDLILERVNIFLLYRAWKKGYDLISESVKIKENCLNYFHFKRKDNSHSKILDKYRNDIIDYLYRENGLKPESQVGFTNLVRISNGIPRHFLIIMKHIYRWSEFYGKSVFKTTFEKIDSRSQSMSISDAALWFLEDARIPGRDGNKMKDSIQRLSDYLRELRFSDLPPECSISSFSINIKVLTSDITEIIDFLEQYSYIIKVDTGRRDKNLNNRNQTYQINGLIAFEWELSLARRGIVDLSYIEMKGIFYPDNDKEYKSMTGMSLSKYNVPFSLGPNQPSLFH